MPVYGMSLKPDICCYDHGVITPMTLIILTLAAMGLTRIIVRDKITMPFRRLIVNGIKTKKRVIWKGSGVNGWLTYLIHCVTCTGFWSTAAVVGSWLLWPDNQALTAAHLILAVAWLAPSLMNLEDRATGGE